eukprot:TRINITY_DN18482_c0_g1_i1.p1 TRINITY_DN18482_c0_g1~~TRINITY_DN18482_c0_g1_i1.p1  ORF type:complete len:580 (+),score=108.68 TRINITY_DN18482_c0_g1_i1:127-1866(+)
MFSVRSVKSLLSIGSEAGSSATGTDRPLDEAAPLAACARRVSLQLRRERLKVGKHSPDLNKFSIFDRVASADREELLRLAGEDPCARRAMGAMVGMAVGDATGGPLEFIPVSTKGSSFNMRSLTYKGEFNKFKLKPGQWTDDTAMGLCLADSLLVCSGYDGSDVRVRFWNWWYRGYNNSFKNDPSRSSSVGLGSNISLSLKAITNDKPTPRFDSYSEDSGNGSLMRLAPVAIYFHRSETLAMKVSAESSYTTHPGPMAADACAFLALVLRRAILRSSRQGTVAQFLEECAASFLDKGQGSMERDVLRLLRSAEPPGSKERCWNWRDAKGPYIAESLAARGKTYNGYKVDEGYFGAFSLDGLAVALFSVYHTRSFGEAISRCVNFLGDADSTGAICGQIAGAFYGVDAIDARLVQRLRPWDTGEVALRGALLYGLAAQLSLEALSSRAGKEPAEEAKARALVATPPVSTLPSEMPPSDEETELVELLEAPRQFTAFSCPSEPQDSEPQTPTTPKKASEAYPSASANASDLKAKLDELPLPSLPGTEGDDEEMPFSPESLTLPLGLWQAPGSRLAAPAPSF